MVSAEAREQLEAALKEAKEDALLSGVNKAMSLMRQLGLCREQVIEPKYVGAHTENRDGHGLSARDGDELMAEIFDVGLDERQIYAVCTELHREDLYKQTVLANGIEGRRPYGATARMLSLADCVWRRTKCLTSKVSAKTISTRCSAGPWFGHRGHGLWILKPVRLALTL